MAEHIPILLYHKIGPECLNPDSWVATNIFREQMKDIIKLNYTSISVRQLIDFHLGISSLPDKPIMLTFDDAYENFYTDAAPVMIGLDIRSVCFVPTAHVEKTNAWDKADSNPEISHMTWEQIISLDKTGMVDFQSHGDTHSYLQSLSTRDIVVELIYSKLALQNALKKRIDSISWPFGGFDERCIQAAKMAGYTIAFTVLNMVQRQDDIRPYAIRRISMGNSNNAIHEIMD